MDNIRWRKAHEPKKALKQFPAASTVPDWLKDQESQWLKANKKTKPWGCKAMTWTGGGAHASALPTRAIFSSLERTHCF